MKSLSFGLITALLITTSAAAFQAGAPAPAPTAAAKVLTINSPVKELVANPKTDAVLKAVIPEVRSDEQFTTLGADLPLIEIAQYAPELTEAKLKTIAAELAKVQASN